MSDYSKSISSTRSRFFTLWQEIVIRNNLPDKGTQVAYLWLGPRVSVSRDESSKVARVKPPSPAPAVAPVEKKAYVLGPSDPEVYGNDIDDFEFRLEDPVTILPADELFSDGKLVPLQISMIRPAAISSLISSPERPKTRRRSEISVVDPYLFSPKAPRCSSRWKELLGLKKLYPDNNAKHKTASSSNCNNSKSLKKFLHRSSKSSDSSLSLPLLGDSDSESLSISSRLSLSSTSSGYEHDDLPRLSLDSDKPNLSQNPLSLSKNSNLNSNPPRVISSEYPTGARGGRSPMRRAPGSTTGTAREVSVDSPRMNSSGKIVFHGLERSSSSPSSFNGGPRFKHRGMERSYAVNIRVTPVLNVPFCSLRGSSKSSVFGFHLFSSQQNRAQQSNNSRNRTDRG